MAFARLPQNIGANIGNRFGKAGVKIYSSVGVWLPENHWQLQSPSV
jgi:hypothetical protein